MKYKPKDLKSTVWIIVIVVMLIAAANFLGIGTMRFATRIGYIGNDGLRNWSASYTMLDGKLKHTIHRKILYKPVFKKFIKIFELVRS